MKNVVCKNVVVINVLKDLFLILQVNYYQQVKRNVV